MKKASMFLPIVFALLVACTKGEGFVDSPVSDGPSNTSSVNKSDLVNLVNKVRKTGCQCGDTWYGPAQEITWNDQLETAAKTHSADMEQKKYFNHTAPDGSDGGVRISRTGYNWWTYGENIAMGYGSEQSVVDGWLQSPGHCRNIMNKSYKEMGVGRSGSYWTQVFASR